MKNQIKRLVLVALFAAAIGLALPTWIAGAQPPAQGTPPQIPHPREGRTDCVSCHQNGLNGAPKFPLDHAGRTNDICLACHTFKQVATQPSPTTAVAATTAPPTQALPTLTVAAAATSAPPTQALPTSTVAAGATLVPPTQALPTSTVAAAAATSAPPTAAKPTSGAPTQPAPTTAAPLSGVPPVIPHTLTGRDQCLGCHQAGVGGAPKVPSSHAGRTNEQCRLCHQPIALPPVVIPTIIPHVPAPVGQNSCVDCHLQQGGKQADIVKQWTASIHASRGVFCTDCHGGDATQKTKETAMAISAGYSGKPKVKEIPALCGSCHARVDLMRQYDIPTDQYSQYLVSVHGQKLAQGDTNVATCYICHDQHGTKEVRDPSSNVYPQNVPGLCGGCHSNATLMKPYNIPTNQYDLYKASVHGIALLQKQDPRAPSCATCHGTHGAAPPGFTEVANVCGSCHSATQDYYLKSKHASNAPGTPKCVTCHGRYDVMPATEALFTGTGARDCGSCHPPSSSLAPSVKQLGDAISASATAFDSASKAIKRASGSGLIVAAEEMKLTDVKTNLITARAAQHTLSFDVVKEKTDKAVSIGKAIQSDADKAMQESVIRRQAMVIAIGVAAIAIVCLYFIRRELYRQLPPKQ